MSDLLYEAPERHECYPPGGTRFEAKKVQGAGKWGEAATEGSIWQCDECGSYWIAKEKLWMKWVPCSRRKAKRILGAAITEKDDE